MVLLYHSDFIIVPIISGINYDIKSPLVDLNQNQYVVKYANT